MLWWRGSSFSHGVVGFYKFSLALLGFPSGWYISNFRKKRKFSPQRPPGQPQARLTQVSYREFLGAPHCLVENTVALREG